VLGRPGTQVLPPSIVPRWLFSRLPGTVGHHRSFSDAGGAHSRSREQKWSAAALVIDVDPLTLL